MSSFPPPGVALPLAAALFAAAFGGGCSKTTPVAPAPGPLAGVVLAAGGAPAAGIAVHAQPLAAAGGVVVTRNATSDASGRFEFAAVAPGAWLVYAGDTRLAAADTASAPASAVTLRLAAAGVLRGSVGLAGARSGAGTVVFVDAMLDVATTDGYGGFELRGVPVGGWWLYASHGAGWRDSARRVVMPAPGDTVRVEPLTLFPLAAAR